MGALRFRERQELTTFDAAWTGAFDSGAPLAGDLLAVPPDLAPHHVAPATWRAARYGVLIALVLAAVTFLRAGGGEESGGDHPFAYLELKAIGPDGRPVTGAIVSRDGTQLGITDSFGEWRRFQRVELGEHLRFHVAKSGAGTASALSGDKQLAVPGALPRTGDLALAGSLQLGATDAARAPGASATARREVDIDKGPAPIREW